MTIGQLKEKLTEFDDDDTAIVVIVNVDDPDGAKEMYYIDEMPGYYGISKARDTKYKVWLCAGVQES